MKHASYSRGFTLLEILLVVAAIAILAGIVILAINPSKQLGDTKNAQRHSDTNNLLNAVYQYALDNNGNLPSGIDATVGTSQVLGTAASGCDSTCAGITTVASCLDLTSVLTPKYLVGIPKDPASGSDTNTDYYINKDAGGRVTVGACDPEQGAVITKTK
jgi:prepilin-type N-terminal cleavage/methylation domain-containing protein